MKRTPPTVKLLLALAAVALLPLPAPAGGPADPLAALNGEFRTIYAKARAAALARTGPVLWVSGDQLVLLRGKERTEADIVPPLYHRLKAVSHGPLAVYLLLSAHGDGKLDDGALADVRRLREKITAARDGLKDRGFSAEQLERQQQLLAESTKVLDFVLQRGVSRPFFVTGFARKMGPLLLTNAAESARLQIDALHKQVAAWRVKLPAEEWEKLKVVVSGSQMPRTHNLAVQYFARLFNETGEGKRIIYAEALFDEAKALNLLGTHLLDRAAAEAFFDDPERLHRDLLADAAAEYLRTKRWE